MMQGGIDKQQQQVREAAIFLSMSLQENKRTEAKWEDVKMETFSGNSSDDERGQEHFDWFKQNKITNNKEFAVFKNGPIKKPRGRPKVTERQYFDESDDENNDNNDRKVYVKNKLKRPKKELEASDNEFSDEDDNDPDYSDELRANDKNFSKSPRKMNKLLKEGSRTSKMLEYKFPCDHCLVILQTKNRLDRHLLRKHGISLPCEKCDETFEDIKGYNKHMKTNHPSHICTICGEKRFRKYDLDQHMEAQHSGGVPCPHCGTNLATQFILNQHIKRFHEDNEIQECTKCDYKTSLPNEMKQHYKRRHTDEMLETCEFCGDVFKGLKKHLIRTGCGGQKIAKNVPCNQCPKTFSSKIEMRTHVKRIHENVKDKVCPHCSYATYSGFNLKLHVSKMHLGTGLIKEPCPHCDKETTNLKHHMETYHNALL